MVTEKSEPSSSPRSKPNLGSDYPVFLGDLQTRFEERTARQPLFTTDATGLWETYLSALPEDQRQIYTCFACRRFIERFGHLVTIDEAGHARSAFWDEHPAATFNVAAVRQLREQVERFEKVLAVDAARDEIERAHALADIYREERDGPDSPE